MENFKNKFKAKLTGNSRYYPCSTQEWRDSIYTFNKNTIKLIPVANNHIKNMINSYFNLFSKNLERNIGLLRIRKWKRRLLGRKIWISKPELKYSNNKIIINLYIYNRQLTFLFKRLLKLKANWGKLLKKTFVLKLRNNLLMNKRKFHYRNKISRVLKIINNKEYKENIFANAIKRINTELIKSNNDFIDNPNEYEDLLYLADFLEKYPNFFNKETLRFITNNNYLNLIKNTLIYQMSFLKVKQMILLNRFKFKNTYLTPIKRFIQIIYKKKIDFNLVSLKKFNYDSHILAQIVTSKIRNRKNRPLKVVKSSVRKSKVYEFNKGLLWQDKVKLTNKQNYALSNYIVDLNNPSDFFNNILNNRLSSNSVQELAFNSVKNKVIVGIKVQATGRITRRIIAQRATYKVRYKGTLKNIDASYKGISAVILKGYEKSALQYAHLGSKRRIGAFGIKTSINAY